MCVRVRLYPINVKLAKIELIYVGYILNFSSINLQSLLQVRTTISSTLIITYFTALVKTYIVCTHMLVMLVKVLMFHYYMCDCV